MIQTQELIPISKSETLDEEKLCLELDGQVILLKKGLAKKQVMQLLGNRRSVDILPNCECEIWSYCFHTKTGVAYCEVIFKDGSLSDFSKH